MIGVTLLVSLLTVYTQLEPAKCACTPIDVRNDLIRCLQYQGINTYYQFPIFSPDNVTALCTNSTCVAYCMQQVVTACQSQAFMSHLVSADAIKAAYLGFCTSTNETEDALSCTSGIDNQDALNVISVFENAWQGYYDNNTADNATLCSNWTTMKTGLDSLVSAACSDPVGKLHWDSFLNTLMAPCTSLTPTFYTNFSDTSVSSCNSRAPAVNDMDSLVVAVAIIFHTVKLFIYLSGIDLF